MNRTVPSTCTVFLCITGGTRASTGVSALSGTNLYSGPAPPTLLPSIPNPAYCLLLLRRSNEWRHTKTAHALYSPALPRARGGVQVFSTFRLQMFQSPYSPASAAQHPQPCLLLLRRSNECRFPSHTETAQTLYSPALPRARGGVQVFNTFRSQMFQNLYSPASAAKHPQPCSLLLRRSNESH